MPIETNSPSSTPARASWNVALTRKSRLEHDKMAESTLFDQLLRFETRSSQSPEEPVSPSVLPPQSSPTGRTDDGTSVASEDDEAADQPESNTNEKAAPNREVLDALAVIARDTNNNDTKSESGRNSEELEASDKEATDKSPSEQGDSTRVKKTAEKVDQDTETSFGSRSLASDSLANTDPSNDDKGNTRDQFGTPTEDGIDNALKVGSRGPKPSDDASDSIETRIEPTMLFKSNSDSDNEQLPHDTDREIQRSKNATAKRDAKQDAIPANLAAGSSGGQQSDLISGPDRESAQNDRPSQQTRVGEQAIDEVPREGARARRRSDRIDARSRREQSDPSSRDNSDRTSVSEKNVGSRSDISSASVGNDKSRVPLESNLATGAPPNPATMTPSAGVAIAAQLNQSPDPSATSPQFKDTRSIATANRTESISQGNSFSSFAPNGASAPSDDARPTLGTNGATGARLTPYQETKIVQRVLRGMEQLANGGGQVRLRLHPPELGSLQLSLRIEGQAVFADMEVETVAARDTLLKNLPALKERLADQGLQVEQFEVKTEGNAGNGLTNNGSKGDQRDGQSRSSGGESKYAISERNRLSHPSATVGSEAGSRWTRAHGSLDYEA